MTEDELIAVVRSRMEELGWNQKDLASCAGESESQVSRVLRKHTEARVTFWLNLLDTLGLDLRLVKRKSVAQGKEAG